MALVLKRITNPYECVRCDITKKIITYGEEYYEDDEDGFIVDFEYYYDTKMAKKREEAMSKLNAAMDRFSYQQQLLQKQRDYLQKTMFDRPLAGKDTTSWDNYQKRLYTEDNDKGYVVDTNKQYNDYPTTHQKDKD